VRQAFSFLSFEGFSIASVFGGSCGLSLDWQGKLVLMTFSPLVLIAMGFSAALIKRAVWKSKFSLLEVMNHATPAPFSPSAFLFLTVLLRPRSLSSRSLLK
jgi:hypothetical protein